MHDRLAAALDSQLAEEDVDVEFDGVVVDAEALGDSLVGEALGEELEHFALAGCQGLGQLFGRSRGVAEENRRNGLVECQQALRHGSDGGGLALAVNSAGEDRPRAGGQSVSGVVLGGHHGQDGQASRLGGFAEKGDSGLGAQPEIPDDYVGRVGIAPPRPVVVRSGLAGTRRGRRRRPAAGPSRFWPADRRSPRARGGLPLGSRIWRERKRR
jgi:hypothetical protein